MRLLSSIVCIYLIVLSQFAMAQQVKGQISDAKTRSPIPFSTIRYGTGNKGIIAGLDGTFQLPEGAEANGGLEISCMGYKTLKMPLPLKSGILFLEPAGNELGTVTVKPPYEKIRNILNRAIANRDRNNPDKYDRYSCNIYYKMKADVSLPDSAKKDTSESMQEFNEFTEQQHLLISETFSKRNWRKPQQLQEDIIATRLSGLKTAAFTSVVTDILPFHAYTDYITLNGKDYHNPVCPGYELHYRFNLSDELMDGADTIWVLSFTPKGRNGNSLYGKVYIHSDGYAIAQLAAKAKDTIMKQTVRIEHQYAGLSFNDSGKRWFPAHLNYVIEREMKSGKTPYYLYINGYSQIDSVSWNDNNTRFDKRHTVRLNDNAAVQADSLLAVLRPGNLSSKEKRTYKVIDSLGAKVKADKIMEHMRNLPKGRISAGKIDIDLVRLMSYNRYENFRLGLGLQTNERLIKWLSVGGWAGYGLGDKRWKYGGFAEAYLDKYQEFVLKAGYNEDIVDPGRVRISSDIDKNAVRQLLLTRADLTKTYAVSLKKKFGYWSAELGAQQQRIIPTYNYALRVNGTDHANYEVKEAALNLRYAFAEHTAPFLGTYLKTSSKYPVWYAKIAAGTLQSGNLQEKYLQATSALLWQVHINRVGTERIMVEAARSWSSDPLPVSKLFAGNGFKYDAKEALSLYAFGGLMTLFPYEVYTDRFIQAIYRHDIDWKLYRLESKSSKFSSAPNLAIQYGFLYGSLKDRDVHQSINFTVPDKGYHEAGLMLNNLLRLSNNTYYQSLNFGYFYHLTPATANWTKNGKFVIGASIEL